MADDPKPSAASAEPTIPPEGDAVREAKEILAGRKVTAEELKPLYKRLKKERQFGYTRRVLGRARTPALRDANRALWVEFCQQQAVCTYKDLGLPAERRLDRALAILGEAGDLAETTNPETLGIAGAIHKRKWEVDGRTHHLERSLFYYLKGHEKGDGSDNGYTGVNAAFVLDLVASLESKAAEDAGTSSPAADARRERARRIREDLVEQLSKKLSNPDDAWLGTTWWFLVTLVEAFLGLERFEEARLWARKAAAIPDVPDWERESTARQLVATARLLDASMGRPGGSPKGAVTPWMVLEDLLGHDVQAVRSAVLGKVGLALSGGGFRASLFHIGVLARLAELDLLRHVEALSCVSGGSIIGAYYYLALRKRLEESRGGDIPQAGYLDLVEEVQREFLAGVQTNIRMRVIASPWANLKMAFTDYSRTERLGELYEEKLYSRVKDGLESGPRALPDLRLTIKGFGGATFNPRDHNWRRGTKVPNLILNATTVNTGHNWQFGATWMGEPPGLIDEEIDANWRLRRMYHDEAPEAHRRFRLGAAVGASSCVPGLFEPLSIEGLYPREPDDMPKPPPITVRLVDGGVYDNQGVAGLLEQGCTVMIVSDASGQRKPDEDPGGGIMATLSNANGILMQRVRKSEYEDLASRKRGALLAGFAFVHLKKDLEADAIDWVDCHDPYDASDDARPPQRRGLLTAYGVRKDVQRRLAEIRTDLDSFNDTEAYALMLSGYLMIGHEVKERLEDALGPVINEQERDWDFFRVQDWMVSPEKHKDLERGLRLLEVAHYVALKPWRFHAALKVLAGALGLGAAGGLLWAVWRYWSTPVAAAVDRAATLAGFGSPLRVTVGAVAMVVGLALLGAFMPKPGRPFLALLHPKETLRRLALGVGTAVVGFLVGWLHLMVFDPLYLSAGRITKKG
jgi:predicted acylesterase/phospholipase RssA